MVHQTKKIPDRLPVAVEDLGLGLKEKEQGRLKCQMGTIFALNNVIYSVLIMHKPVLHLRDCGFVCLEQLFSALFTIFQLACIRRETI